MSEEFDFNAEVRKARDEIVAKHPRMAEPCFAAALANSAIAKASPKLFAWKKRALDGRK